jgi:anti-anti-sigma factor
MSALWVHSGSDGVLHLAGELDLDSLETFDAAANERLNPTGDVIVDLTDLTFMDATGAQAFLRLAKRLWPRSLILRNPSREVAKVIELLEIEGRLAIQIGPEPVGEGRQTG